MIDNRRKTKRKPIGYIIGRETFPYDKSIRYDRTAIAVFSPIEAEYVLKAMEEAKKDFKNITWTPKLPRPRKNERIVVFDSHYLKNRAREMYKDDHRILRRGRQAELGVKVDWRNWKLRKVKKKSKKNPHGRIAKAGMQVRFSPYSYD